MSEFSAALKPAAQAFQRCRKRCHERSGLALLATVLLLVLVAVLTTAGLIGAMAALSAASSGYHDSRVFYAAEAGAEFALGQIETDLRDGFLSDQELSDVQPPPLEAFDYSGFRAEKIGAPVVETITDGPYAGLYALTQLVQVHSRAEDRGGSMAEVVLGTKAQAIPIFQFAIFYEDDLEATNGPPMDFAGRVHSNGNIYLSSDNAWYRDMITTPKKIIHDRKDHHSVKNGVFINDALGNEMPLDFDSRTHPDPEAFKAESCRKFDCRVQSDAFGTQPLRLPLPESVPTYELIRPREDSDGTAERQIKFGWNADMYVTVDLTDIRTSQDACASAPPADLIGEISLVALDPVVPGESVTFAASYPLLDCEDFDGRADLYVKFDNVDHYRGGMTGCTFTVTLPTDIEELEIEIELEQEDYAQLSRDIRVRLKYDLEGEGLWPNITVERPAGKEVPAAWELCHIFVWQWSDFYDGREENLRDAVNVNIAQLSSWVAGSEARKSEVLYVRFLLPSGIGEYSQKARDLVLDATLDPAVRMMFGAQLPNRMTVASEWPVYVTGDYNRISKRPAALAGDAITILSSAWPDSLNRPPDPAQRDCQGHVSENDACQLYLDWRLNWSYRTAQETTVNAAFLAGHWPTPCDHEDPLCPGGYENFYGGGIENFPRFLENWSGVWFHYRGALISPFTSQKTTGDWNGTYYVPPKRDWAFDIDFYNPSLLPPATPNVGVVVRTAFREAY